MSTSAARIVEAMAKAGCSIEQAAAVLAELAAQRAAARVRRRCEWAVAAALFPAEPATVARESVFLRESKADSAASPAEDLPRSAPVKSAARHGLLTTRTLRPAARAVGARLVEHLNLSSGRCDPGIKRLAADLGLDPRTVRRSLGQLEAAGLVVRDIHAGRGHSNSYRLDLIAMAGLAVAVTTKTDSVEKGTLESAKAGTGVRQNRVQKQIPVGGVRQGGRRVDPRQPQLLLPIAGRRDAGMAHGARQRLDADLERAHRESGFSRWGLTADQLSVAVEREAASPGAGLSWLMAERQRAGPAPPVAVSDGLRTMLARDPSRAASTG